MHSTVIPKPAVANKPAEPHKPAVVDAASFRSRADEVYAQLKRDVADFRLVPGDRFTEGEISERLGVSRTPVRQALYRLQQPRIAATYDKHAKILRAVQRRRGDQAAMLMRAHIETSQAEVRKITLHQVHLARQGRCAR